MTVRPLVLLLSAVLLIVPLAPAGATSATGRATDLSRGAAPEVDITDVQVDAEGNEMTSLFVTSFDGTQIDLNVCRPAAADAQHPMPVVLSSHGWGGQKSDCLNRTGYFNAGIGFASMTQRGNGSSGGQNNVMDPDFEGRDIMAVIDHLASLGWVQKDDGPDGTDPVLGGLGGSYGGGFQWVGAFTDQMRRGAPTRFNTLVIGNTWYDLRGSLAPQDVLRTVMVNGLYASGMQRNDLAPWISQAIVVGNATGLIVDGPAPTDYGSRLAGNGAAWFVRQGMQLDVPVLQTQGARDLVFPLNDAIDAREHALTERARGRSLLANHHSGHSVPGQLPQSPLSATARSSETCPIPGDLQWFRQHLKGEDLGLRTGLALRTVDGDCHALEDLPAPETIEVDSFDGTVIANGPHGVVEMQPVLDGHATIAGTPRLTFTSANSGADSRIFWGLAVGSSAEDALLVDAQWMPSRVATPSLGVEVSIDLGAVVTDVEEGETLFLVASSSAEQFAAHASRVPGATVLSDVVLELPVLD